MKNRINKLYNLINVDIIFISDREDVYYFTGFWGSNGYCIYNGKELYLITDSRYIEKAEKTKFNFVKLINQKDINSVDDFLNSIHVDNKKNIDKIRLGLIYSKIDIYNFQNFTLNGFECIDITNSVEEIRLIKDNNEIDKLKKSQEIAEKSFLDLKEYIKEGVSELELKGLYYYLALQNGVEDLSFDTIVAFGENSAIPHHESENRKLKNGDTILIDCGVRYKHYCSDMTRTFSFGKPNTKIKNLFKLVESASKIAEDSVNKYRDLSIASSSVIDFFENNRVNDLYLHSLGHGVGIDIHEKPYLKKEKNGYKLTKNQVFTLEPGLYLKKIGGVRLENMYFIDENMELVNLNKTKFNIEIL